MARKLGDRLAYADPRCIEARTYARLVNAFGLCVGASGVIVAVIYFALPDSALGLTALARQLGSWSDLWHGLYGVAGVILLTGVWAGSRPWEAVGLCLTTAAITINVAAILATYGVARGFTVAPTLIAFALACILRVLIVADFVYPSDGERRRAVKPPPPCA